MVAGPAARTPWPSDEVDVVQIIQQETLKEDTVRPPPLASSIVPMRPTNWLSGACTVAERVSAYSGSVHACPPPRLDIRKMQVGR